MPNATVEITFIEGSISEQEFDYDPDFLNEFMECICNLADSGYKTTDIFNFYQISQASKEQKGKVVHISKLEDGKNICSR